MLRTKLTIASLAAIVSIAVGLELPAQEATNQDLTAKLKSALVFHAPFDGTADAKRSQGDGKILTAESLARKQLTPGLTRPHVSLAKDAGKYGDCLRFTDKAKEVLCFAGTELPFSSGDWSASISFWLRLNPDKDLKPGYCDPLQITQKAWNDAAIFVDFDKDLPRDFRLGVFADLKAWNPENIPWEKWPVESRPMVTVKRPPFSSTAWTHVALTLDHVNTDHTVSVLHLNGQQQGALKQPVKFTWEPNQTAIMLGIEYIGDLDDLMIFNRALTSAEVMALSQRSESF